MWEIYEHKRSTKQLESLLPDVLKRYEKWNDIVSISGPGGLRKIKGFRDETLRGEWKGHRSLRLNIQCRVIYNIRKALVLVRVINVTPQEYRRK